MKRRLITSALPYVNNIPHLGNLIQVLSADVFARFCRSRGYETLYVCGTDEYGTATETRAMEEGISPQELCDRYYAIHRDIYSWFNIAFDHFGRTSRPEQTRIVQDIFQKVYEAGYITQHSIRQLYSEASDMFLADRYVRGTCPHCAYRDARGDQCENCGKLLDPSELIDPRSVVDESIPILKDTTHLYLNLPALLPKLQEWMEKASLEGRWAKNAIQMTQAWIRDGLKERAITRDLKWGIPVPLEGFEKKVFYVWFDAPIGYVSITADLTKDWESWWKNPDEVELFQFIGKDNIPFHTVIFPSSLLASGEDWTLLHHMSSSEYLNYESGKFSKSKGVGVFGNDVQDTGIPADVWRFYIFFNRPETSDYVFTWKDFQEKVNKELIGNLANLVNRTLSFLLRFFDGEIPAPDHSHPQTQAFWSELESRRKLIEEKLEWAELRDALRAILELSDFGNKTFQESEPWKLRTSDPEAAKRVLANLAYLVRDLGIMIEPYLPETSRRIAEFLGQGQGNWAELDRKDGLSRVAKAEILFTQLDDKLIAELRDRFSGSQKEREEKKRQEQPARQEGQPQKKKKPHEIIAEEDAGLSLPERLAKRVDLRVARILKAERHPEAEKLYIETLDDGQTRERVIVSGLVPHYKAEELEGKQVILVNNLKPAKLRGVLSQGMLLAASSGEGEDEIVEVIEAPWAQPGTRVQLAGRKDAEVPGEIDVNTFFDIPIGLSKGRVQVDGIDLLVDGRTLTTERLKEGSVG